ncbi:hypothetical protein [Paenibacillus lemnae]|uniref:Uncharacterized protein n=1 Tax=Paenibacillus lemnae TaxID=1330551 RepID=A0A848MA14_PAELE|nr:hypothetical protein [Paenibacillus lemnae]NMO97897.1 hypothetical protein [Paenibacillus lemnae]
MRTFAGQGWASLKDQFYVIILLFIYRLLWGYCLYRLVKSVVIPLLMRFPDPAPSELSRLLYFFEGEMALEGGGILNHYVWVLLGLLVLRMMLTPLIRAGIYYNLHREAEGERGLFWFQGMRRFWKPVTLFYLLELILLLAPAGWLLPKMLQPLMLAVRDPAALLEPALWLAAWVFYAWLIRLILLYMQFSRTSGNGILQAVLLCLRHFGKAMSLSLLIGGSGALMLLLLSGLSLWWAGLAGLILHQASYFVQSLFQLWGITSQYQVWKAGSRQH